MLSQLYADLQATIPYPYTRKDTKGNVTDVSLLDGHKNECGYQLPGGH
jgi:hypothetical protein